MKIYSFFVNDHSGSMQHLATAAKNDYNTLIGAVKDAATREMLDSVVSVIGIGLTNSGRGIKRQVVISNPHVLKPIDSWPTPGGTPLWDGIGDAIDLGESLPDANDPETSFVVYVTTDGKEEHSTKYRTATLAEKIRKAQNTQRWTFVFRIPKGHRRNIEPLGVPLDNIQEWDTTVAGMAASTAATTAAVSNFYTQRSAGTKSSSAFYATAAAVNTAALTDITKDVSLYVVPAHEMGIEIQPFILKYRMQYLNGAAFYQLTKTEARVQPTKMIAIRDRSTGKIYAGKQARQMIGLPTDQNARLHPGDHGNYDIFIQSNSINRKLVAGTGVLYWEAIGKPFTEADLAYLKPKAAAPAVVALPAVAPTNKPTASPIPVTKKAPAPEVNGRPVKFFDKRDDARDYARNNGLPKGSLGDIRDEVDAGHVGKGHNPQRWFVYLA